MTIVPKELHTLPASAFASRISSEAVIVVPCYNEAERLDSDAFLSFLDDSPKVSFVFVDDGSRDLTLARLSRLQCQRPGRIHVLTLSRNSGKAEAVRQGLIYASSLDAELLGYWDADLATPLDAIEDFIRVANRLEDVTVVFGSRRALQGHRIDRTLSRRIVSRLCALLARQAVRLPVGDTQCGAKLLRNTDTLRSAIDTPFSAGWLFDVELLARLSAATPDKRAFYEQPLCQWDEVAGSKVTSLAIVKSGLSMMRLIAESRLGLPTSKKAQVDAPLAQVIFDNSPAQLKSAA